jgi:hypothetical protein
MNGNLLLRYAFFVLGVAGAAAILVAIAWFGRNMVGGGGEYLLHAKRAEARTHVDAIVANVLQCAKRTPAMPGILAVRACAAAVSRSSDHFDYRWENVGSTAGAVRAFGDIDGDRMPECVLEKTLVCVGSQPCAMSSPGPCARE